jgi:hypothetical protein
MPRSKVESNERRPDIIVVRDGAEITPAPQPSDDGEGYGHPLPADGRSRHGSIPESIERKRGHGSN